MVKGLVSASGDGDVVVRGAARFIHDNFNKPIKGDHLDIEIGAIASGSIRIEPSSVGPFLVGENKINVEGIGTSVEAGEKIYFENGGVFVLSDPAGKGSTELMGQLQYANVGRDEDGTIK